MIDAHIHLEQYSNIEESIKRWQEAGITAVVAVSSDLRSSYRTLELKQKFPDVPTTPLLLYHSLKEVASFYHQDIKITENIIVANTKRLYGSLHSR